MKRLLPILLLCLTLSACAPPEPDPDTVDLAACPTIPMEDVTEFPLLSGTSTGASGASYSHIPTEDGIFLVKMTQIDETGWSPDPAFLWYDDFATGELYPVCTKSNCTHDSYDCNAYFPNAHHLHYDGEYLYYFTGTQPSLWRMKPDGTDRKLIFHTTEEKSSLPTLLGVVYSGRKVYFAYHGAMLNQETMEIEGGEYICEGDLDTGELRTLPVQFLKNRNGSTLNLYGLFGGQLLLRHSFIVSGGLNYQKNEETLFLLDIDTCNVTVLARWTWDTRDDDSDIAYTYNFSQGIVLLRGQTGEAVRSTYADGNEAVLYPGNRILVDLNAGKAYRQTGLEELSSEQLIDSKLLLKRWSQDRSFVEQYVLDLSTGERSSDAWGTVWMKVEDFQYTAGDYYLIFNFSGDGNPKYGKIKKDAYWAGDHDAVEYYPEWVIMVM